MDLLKPFKAAGKAVKSIMDKVNEMSDRESEHADKAFKLQDWQDKLDVAKAAYNIGLMDEREYLYLGARNVDKNVNSKQMPNKMANNVYNIIFELIESEVDPTIPQPSVRSKMPMFADLASMIEDSITNDLSELGIERINDYNERITPVQGLSIIEVGWNPDYKHHLYRGELQLIHRHPKQLIPQPGVYRLQQMDYFFVLESVTKDQIRKVYGVDVDGAEQDHKDLMMLSEATTTTANMRGEIVTKVTCWYKDEDGDVSKFSWVENDIVEDLPKYFHRRLERCVECDTVKDMAFYEEHGTCAVCGSKRFKESIEKEETLALPTQIGSGEVLPAGTTVPYFTPTRYPISVRINVPKNFAFEGQSDVDIIRDQQDTIKKAATKAEEKIVKGGSVITMSDDLNVTITDQTYQTLKMTPQQRAAFGVENLQADISPEMAWIEDSFKKAQNMLGITDSFQGKEDQTAKSGVAKQIQVQQASGRLQSKQQNKFEAFKELFEIMFEFKLAFYDELRPYLAKDKDGKDLFQTFDKYAFIIRDAEGKLYYNTDFVFSADSAQGLPKDKIFLFNQAKEMAAAGLMDQLQFWSVMETINFPQAKQIKKQIEERQQQERQMQEAQMQAQQQAQMAEQAAQAEATNQPPSFDDHVAGLSGSHQEMYKKLPPEAKAEIMRQVQQ